MTLAEAIAVAMLALPCPTDEPKAECRPWRQHVSEAIAHVAEQATCDSEWSPPECEPLWPGAADELAAVLVEIANHEATLSKRIQDGRCRPEECDGIRSRKTGKWTGRHLARSMWQLHESPYIPGIEGDVPHAEWLASTGTTREALVTAARAATRLLVHAPGAFGLDRALGPGERGRAARKILGRIRAAMAPREATP